MLLQVDGWFGAGKSVLWMLLDGHPNVFCSPIHDYSYCAFLNQSDNLDWVKTKHIEILRKALARTQYYKFEKVFRDGFMSFEFSTEEVLKIPYNVDYYKFDKLFIDRLLMKDKWTLNEIIETLYRAIWESQLKSGKNLDVPKWFASMGNPLFINEYENFPKIFPGGKSIQVRRSVEKIIATRSNRKPRSEDFKTWTFFSDGFEKRIAEGEVEKILSYYDTYDQLVEKYPDVFIAVDFLDLVNNTEETIKKVAEFIGIPFHSNLLMASYQGKELIYKGKKYVG
ncbi:MAG: sulfotransferase, partial [bacterium]